jgi:hypothetical protein
LENNRKKVEIIITLAEFYAQKAKIPLANHRSIRCSLFQRVECIGECETHERQF